MAEVLKMFFMRFCVRAVAAFALLAVACVSVEGDNTPPATPSVRAPYPFYALSAGPIEIRTSDSDNDDVSFKISVTDNQTHKQTVFTWSQYFPVSEPVVFVFAPQDQGSYKIVVQARDSMNAVSDPGDLLVSVDPPLAGTWHTGFSGVGFHLTGISFGSTTAAWAVGGTTVLTTATSGSSWMYQATINNTMLQDVDFVSTTHGWVVGTGGMIAATSDGGANWNIQDSGTNADLVAVRFLDQNTGWACGNSVVLATTDGGTSWNPITPFTGNWKALSLIDANTGWAASLNGDIARTVDGGVSWSPQYASSQHPINSIDMVTSLMGWAVGNGQAILQTVDGGTTWTDRNPGIDDYSILDVDFIDSQKGWVLTFSDVYYTPNGGSIWFQASLPAMTNAAMDFFGPSNGCIVGRFGAIAYTTDGGIDLASAVRLPATGPATTPGIRMFDPLGTELTIEGIRQAP